MGKKEITPQIIITELLENFPDSARILIKRRMACVGCNMAAFETLEDAAGIYGILINDLLSELRQALLN